MYELTFKHIAKKDQLYLKKTDSSENWREIVTKTSFQCGLNLGINIFTLHNSRQWNPEDFARGVHEADPKIFTSSLIQNQGVGGGILQTTRRVHL